MAPYLARHKMSTKGEDGEDRKGPLKSVHTQRINKSVVKNLLPHSLLPSCTPPNIPSQASINLTHLCFTDHLSEVSHSPLESVQTLGSSVIVNRASDPPKVVSSFVNDHYKPVTTKTQDFPQHVFELCKHTRHRFPSKY